MKYYKICYWNTFHREEVIVVEIVGKVEANKMVKKLEEANPGIRFYLK